MKKIVIVFCALLSSLSSMAQEVKMRDLFASMPDSLLPFVTKNNRLDCIDFIENDMEAKVRNKLDDFVELKKMTANYLLMQMSEQSRVEMKYVASSDSMGVIYVVRTYLGPAADSHIECYDQNWQSVKVNVERPKVEAFFDRQEGEGRPEMSTGPKGNDGQKYAEKVGLIVAELKDMTFLEAVLAEDANILTWKIGLEQLSPEDRKVAEKLVKTVVRELR